MRQCGMIPVVAAIIGCSGGGTGVDPATLPPFDGVWSHLGPLAGPSPNVRVRVTEDALGNLSGRGELFWDRLSTNIGGLSSATLVPLEDLSGSRDGASVRFSVSTRDYGRLTFDGLYDDTGQFVLGVITGLPPGPARLAFSREGP